MSRGCPVRVLKKIYKSWLDMNEKGEVSDSMFLSDDEFAHIIVNAEEKFGLTEKDQDHELFFTSCLSDLSVEISKRGEERRNARPVWDR